MMFTNYTNYTNYTAAVRCYHSWRLSLLRSCNFGLWQHAQASLLKIKLITTAAAAAAV